MLPFATLLILGEVVKGKIETRLVRHVHKKTNLD